MNRTTKNETPNLFGIFVSKAAALIEFDGYFAPIDDDEEDQACLVWNEFVRAYGALVVEFKEEIRQALIESGEYEVLENGKFLRKPTILDSSLLEEK